MMDFPFYMGDGKRRGGDAAPNLPVAARSQLINPENYLADPGLVDACNVALLLGQPLLLTGEPGTGKTAFADSLASELGLGKPLKFETKSTSEARDLFYTYDALRRFHDGQIHSPTDAAPTNNPFAYLDYQALGLAILRTWDESVVKDYLSPDFDHPGKCRSVVLIDEADKAPRDFPNDLLNELEQSFFRIPEFGNVRIDANPDLQPVVVITSNSEKDLPAAFLRRCIYYNIPFPDEERLASIIQSQLGLRSAGNNDFVDRALDLFYALRADDSGLAKKPATAELLGWLITLRQTSGDKDNPLEQPEIVLRTLSALIKSADDQQRAMEIALQWVNKDQK